MKWKQLSPTEEQMSSFTRSHYMAEAPVQTLSPTPVRRTIMSKASQPNEPSMAGLMPMYHIQCLPKGNTTIPCKLKNVQN